MLAEAVELLGRADVEEGSTFVSLGGDSLSYVEVSIRLEGLLGTLPASWHVTPVAQLQELAGGPAEPPPVAARPKPTERRRRTIETNVWLRALAIVLIVGTHADLFSLQGTAHALLVLVGFNAVRFALASEERRDRLRSLGRGASRVVLPTLAVIVPAHVIWGYYEPRNLVLANWLFGLLGVRLGGWVGYLIAGFIGACILIALGRVVRR